MKIILEAFDKLYSAPMEVPEDTGLTFRLAMRQRMQVAMPDKGVPGMSPLNKMATFEFSGYYDGNKAEDGDMPRIYKLVDIH